MLHTLPPSSFRLLPYTLATVFLFLAPSFAQVVGGGTPLLHQFDGFAADENLGASVSGAGDVNGDGYDDIIVGAFRAAPGGMLEAGSAYVYSGLDGWPLYQWNGAAAYDNFGESVSGAGDVNGDGYDDLIVGAPLANPWGISGAGSAYVYSGLDGRLLHQWNGSVVLSGFGWSVSGAGDVNADGYDDLIVGAIFTSPGGMTGAGSTYVYSGLDGALLYQWDGAAAFENFGGSVSGAGDVNGDGYDDLVVGAPHTSPGGMSEAGSTYAYSGLDGTLLYQWDGAAAYEDFGWSVSGAGDINADGYDDLIVGAPYTSPGGMFEAGSTYAYSGLDGTLLYQWDGAAVYENLGSSVSGAGDVNADGYNDLIVGAKLASPGWYPYAGSSYVYSGLDGSLLLQWNGTGSFNYLGSSVSGAGDVNADGYDDLIVGAFGAAPGGLFDAGSAYVFGLDPYLTITANSISASSANLIGLDLNFPMEAAGFEYRVLLSTSGTGPFFFGVDIPLSLDAWTMDSYLGIYPFPTAIDLQGTLDANGLASAVFGTRAGFGARFVGATGYFAAIAIPPGTLLPTYSSMAIPITIVP